MKLFLEFCRLVFICESLDNSFLLISTSGSTIHATRLSLVRIGKSKLTNPLAIGKGGKKRAFLLFFLTRSNLWLYI